MPELPEVETVRRTLDPLLRGRNIAGFELRWPRTIGDADPAAFASRIVGRTIVSVERRAKLIVIRLDDASAMTVHLRMTGELLFSDTPGSRAAEREPYLRALVTFADGSALLFYDTRKFGRIGWLPAGAEVELDTRYGVEPLASEFTPAALATLLARRRQIKPLLLDQTVIAGLGNIYVDEALHRARIHPLCPACDIDDAHRLALHAAIVDILSAAIAAHGTTFRDYRTGTGESGEFAQRLRVYGSKPGTPCPDCGTPLERLVVGQRGTVFCPHCQQRVIVPDTRRR